MRIQILLLWIKIFGKRLCEYSLMAAKKSKYVDKIFVSTDCPSIKSISKKYGAEVPFIRPKKLATSRASMEDVLTHGIKKLYS